MIFYGPEKTYSKIYLEDNMFKISQEVFQNSL